MIRSMTGFGRFEGVIDGRSLTLEIKSVNHRFSDFSFKLGRSCSFLEERLKGLIAERVSRGKVDVCLSVSENPCAEALVEINRPLAAGYVKAFRELSEEYDIKNDISASVLAKYNDVLSVRKAAEDEEQLWRLVKIGAEKALEDFVKTREKEGEKLKADVLLRCERILSLVENIEKRSPELVSEYREKLTQRMKEILGGSEIDEQRILTEAAIFADKTAVDEETVRLRSHISQIYEMLEYTEPIGRRLDFTVQEMNREANTIGSKICNADMAHVVVDIKCEIEKIREQVQNIE